MESQNILLFQPARATWNQMIWARNQMNIQVLPTSSAIKKGAVFLANGLKNRMVEVALVIASIFAVLYSLISYPFRYHAAEKHKEVAIGIDLSRLSPEEIQEIESVVHSYLFEKHGDRFNSLSKEEKAEMTRRIISQCARSQKVYGPIVRYWVDNLLEEAHKNNRKLVFMARDGIPFYQVATELMKTDSYRKKYPKLAQNGAIVLGYFSRNVVKSAPATPEVFKRYVSEELGLKKGDQCYFVDIGFSGSMVDPIRQLLPDIEIDFKFLVATSDKAEGFLGDPKNPLPNLESAACNLGVRWLEESHHGNLASATKLVVGEDNRIYPDTLYPKKIRCEEKYSIQYLIRKFSLRRVIDCAKNRSPLSEEEALKAKNLFSQVIGEVKEMKLPLFLGWDY